MQLMENELQRIAPMIWEAMLRLPLEPATEGAPTGGSSGGRTITSYVYITGAWNGAVVLDCGLDFARRAAAIMFNLLDEAPTPSDIHDSMGELANMVGGNVKGLCPEPSHLSLPLVVEGASGSVQFPGARLITKVPFVSGRYIITVSLHERRGKMAA